MEIRVHKLTIFINQITVLKLKSQFILLIFTKRTESAVCAPECGEAEPVFIKIPHPRTGTVHIELK